jgi:hypothetical protein
MLGVSGVRDIFLSRFMLSSARALRGRERSRGGREGIIRAV